MSSRTPRRSFAHPFVVTLAAIPACSGGNASGPPPHKNPPPPTYIEPASPTPAPTDPATEPAVPTSPPEPVEAAPAPPAPSAPGAPAQPKAPDYASRWHVFKSGAACMATVHVDCPKPEAGKAVPTCNPPAPTPYTCPPGMTEGASLTVVRRAHSTTCWIEQPPVKCPPGARCNPPPPRGVDCPK